MQKFTNDIELARYLAQEAGKILLEIQKSKKFEGKELGLKGDRAANAFIIEKIRQYRPSDKILSEEEDDDKSRIGAKRVWIIDPLDGTYEYAQLRDDWAVHIALLENDNPICAAVSIPARNELYTTSEIYSQGNNLTNDYIALRENNNQPILIISRSRKVLLVEELAQYLGAKIVKMGSAGAKTMAIIRGEADIYFHIGEQKVWDNCAPVAIARKNGLIAQRIDGSEFAFNCENIIVDDLIICRPHFYEKFKKFIRLRG
jgi:3'(2'), 5'-bisphosphate nucleotidase